MLDAIRDAGDILAKHGYDGHAEVMAQLLSLHDTDWTAFVNLISGLEMWGGSGAVWEVNLRSSDNINPSVDDHQAFKNAIIRLSKAMDHAGIDSSRSRYIGEVLHSLYEDGR